jgi:3-isopropylmalate/(R)-2-methylmalate dehydratase small subunit
MEKFVVHEGIAAPLLHRDLNTDVVIRIERLVAEPRHTLGEFLFESLRYDSAGGAIPDFVLNREGYRDATILIAGDNFGCGSSREGAVWALASFGVRCVIAPSFGEIFYNNCFQNGLLPIVLPPDEIQVLAQHAAVPARFTVDLERQCIVTPGNREVPFDIAPARREALLEGLDGIGMTLKRKAAIDAYRDRDRTDRPWIHGA